MASLTTKEAYPFLIQKTIRASPTTSMRKFRMKLWLVKVCSKWKMFVWRFIHKALATNIKLWKKEDSYSGELSLGGEAKLKIICLGIAKSSNEFRNVQSLG